jgi:putative N6-adenine-specific DNA methylase
MRNDHFYDYKFVKDYLCSCKAIRYNHVMDFYCYAVTAPGLRDLAARELEKLGILPPGQDSVSTSPDHGGVEFRADLSTLYRANLHLRTASRVLVRLGNFFYARTFTELRTAASRLAWERFLSPGQPIEIRVTCHKSKLYHSDAVAERIGIAIAERLGQASPIQKFQGEEEQNPPQLILARLVNDRMTISIDSSGALLHRRGYRLATGKAPLRETLAAAMLMACNWDRVSPLIDPFCGSGTIPIEAALMALEIPPGINRRFAFMGWTGFDEATWQAVYTEATKTKKTKPPVILASDRDAGAIRIAQENAARAGVAEYIEFTNQAVSAIQPPQQPGWIITNPPYGERVSANKDLRNLYAQFGNVLHALCPGWQVGILCSDPILLGQTRLALDTATRMINGGLSVSLAQGKVTKKE